MYQAIRPTPNFLVLCWMLIMTVTLCAQERSRPLTTEQLQAEIQATLNKAQNYPSWPVALQKAYDDSLTSLFAAFNQATEEEIKQLNLILRDISEPSARKPLENHLAHLARLRTNTRLQLQQLKRSASELVAVPDAVLVAGAAKIPEADSVKAGPSTSARLTASYNTPPLTRTIPYVAEYSAKASEKYTEVPRPVSTESTKTKPETTPRVTSDPPGTANEITIEVTVKGTQLPVTDAIVKLMKVATNSTLLQANGSQQTNDEGKAVFKPTDGTYKIIVQRERFTPYLQETTFIANGTASNPKKDVLSVELSPIGDEYYRSILGFEQSGASSTKSQQNIFFDFYISRPIFSRRLMPASLKQMEENPKKYLCDRADKKILEIKAAQHTGKDIRQLTEKEKLEAEVAVFQAAKSKQAIDPLSCYHPPRFRAWGDFRLSSIPKQSQNVFKGFQSSFASSLNSSISDLPEATQGVSFMTGLQYRIFNGSIGQRRFEFHVVGGGGMTTPLATDDTIQTFKIPKDDAVRYKNLVKRLKELNPATSSTVGSNDPFKETDLDGKENIAFVVKERDRFFRNYYGGIRLETYHNDPTITRPPAIFDVMVGQDELVTGGRLRGSVLRLDGFYPLPISTGNLLYLFGTAHLGLSRTHHQDPLLLPAADNRTTAFNTNTLVVPIPAANKDIYRIGIGLNLFNLFTPDRENK